MTSPDVPLHIGDQCGEGSNSLLLLDQVSIAVTLCEYDDDNLHVSFSVLGNSIATKHRYVVIVIVIFFDNQLQSQPMGEKN